MHTFPAPLPISRNCHCFLLALLAVLCFKSAAKAADPDYLMIRQGNEWTFDVSSEAHGTLEKGTRIVKIGEKVVRNGREYFKHFTRQVLKDTQESTKLVRVDDTGFYSTTEDSTRSNDELVTALPLKIGAS